MGNSGYYTSHIKLEEGKSYKFRYIKNVTLDDGKDYMVLEDIYGIRHFVEKSPYNAYNFSEGSDIICKVDKINCTSRIFLEPDHPVYQTGYKYPFEIIETANLVDRLLITVLDCYNNPLTVEYNPGGVNHFTVGTKITAEIKSIKKGLPEITLTI